MHFQGQRVCEKFKCKNKGCILISHYLFVPESARTLSEAQTAILLFDLNFSLLVLHLNFSRLVSPWKCMGLT